MLREGRPEAASSSPVEFGEELREVQPAPSHGPRRPGALQVAVSLALIVLMAAATLTIYRTHQVAQSWQQRATQAETRLEALTAMLQASEADALQLEQRVGALAAEKAQVEDEREIVVGQRDLLHELVVLSATATGKLEACVHSWERFTNALASGSDLARSYAAEGDRICGEAEADSRRLAQVVDELSS